MSERNHLHKKKLRKELADINKETRKLKTRHLTARRSTPVVQKPGWRRLNG